MIDQDLENRWNKKKSQIQNLSNQIQKVRLNITKDLKGENDKDRLTALVVAIMDKTAERVGNDDSAQNGHYGITGIKKKHLIINGNEVVLKYVAKSGVKQDKKILDDKIAQALKRAIAESPSDDVFVTKDGFKISNDRVNRYLSKFDVSAKDLRGYFANKSIVKKLEEKDLPKDQKERKKVFSEVLKGVAEKLGHGKGTLKNHYLIPEVEINYIEKANIINLSNKDSYEVGGAINNFNYEIGGL